jgi:hypothetical protein
MSVQKISEGRFVPVPDKPLQQSAVAIVRNRRGTAQSADELK